MLRRNLAASLLIIAWAIFPGTIFGAEGSSNSDSSTNLPSPFKVVSRNEEMLGDRPVQRAYLSKGTNQFAFVVPPGFRLNATSPGKLSLINANDNGFITFRVAAPLPSWPRELSADDCRDLVSAQFPTAKIDREFTQPVADHSGPAFDVSWTNSGGGGQSARIVFLPSPAGILEFCLEGNPNSFGANQTAFYSVLLSFRTNERGKLEIAPLSDRF